MITPATAAPSYIPLPAGSGFPDLFWGTAAYGPCMEPVAAPRAILGLPGWAERPGLPNVVMFPEDIFGVGTLRIYIPGREVHRAGHANVFFTNSFSADVLDFADLVVVQRIQSDAQANAVEYALAAGKPVVMDADDNFLRIRTAVRKHWAGKNGGDLARIFERTAMHVDALTVSTAPLKKGYAALNGDITVVPNRADFPDAIPERRPNPRPIIGFAGSGAGDNEWGEAAKGLGRILRERRDVRLIMAGREYRHIFDADVRDRIIRKPWLRYDIFRSLYFEFDIAIAPMADIPFSRSKSPIKALDYGWAGIPMVGGDVLPYRDYAMMGLEKTGGDVVLLAKSPSDWRDHVERLLDDPDERAAIGMRNHRFARTWFNALDAAADWWPVWERAMRKKGAL